MKRRNQPKTWQYLLWICFMFLSLHLFNIYQTLSQNSSSASSWIEISYDETRNVPTSTWVQENNTWLHTQPGQTPTPISSHNRSKNFTLDFAIVGFAKCGTTNLMDQVFGSLDQFYFGNPKRKDLNPNMKYDEIHSLEHGKLHDFVQHFLPHYRDSLQQQEQGQMEESNDSTSTNRIYNGFKSPHALQSSQSLQLLSLHFPTTKFIVTVRHPILMFQSLYNYRMRLKQWATINAHNKKGITPWNRIGTCDEEICQNTKENLNESVPQRRRKVRSSHNVHPLPSRSQSRSSNTCVGNHIGFGCTDWGNYHHFLSRLGWTSLSSHEEWSFLDFHTRSIHSFPHASLFLMEMRQMEGTNETQSHQFILDLEDFLHVPHGTLRPLPSYNKTLMYTERKPLQHLAPESVQKSQSIEICDPQYADVRRVLLHQAQQSSQWIQQYFLPSPHVFVSDKEYFVSLLKDWMVDPCEVK